jgi:hypothetical protein
VTRSAERNSPVGLLSAGLALAALLATAGALEQSFSDTVFPPSVWLVVNADLGVRNWQRLDIGTRTPPGCAYCGWEGYYLRNNDWLITPQCSVVTGDRFSFWCRAQDDAHRESLEVWISTGPPYVPAFTRLDAFGTSSIAYTFHEYDLSAYAGQKVFLAFVYRSWNQYGLMIDDVSGPTEWNPVHDVGVTRILAPTGSMRLGRVVRPSCSVSNFTGSSEWLRVSYDISGLWHGDTGIALAPYESTAVTFPEVAFWQPDTHTVTCATHLGADQRFWNDTAQAQLAVYAFQPRGGPDSLGYAWFDSDDPLGPDYNWQELYAQGTLLGWGDDSLWQLDLPWPFRLYGRDYTMAWVSTNGWLALGPPSVSNPADSNVAIPNAFLPNRLIAPFWDDLWINGNEGGIWYQTFDDSILIIEWYHARRKGCKPCSLNFEAKLFRSGAIEFHYAGIDAGDQRYDVGMSATVGIENYTGTVGLQYLYNGDPFGNLLESGRAIRFVPPQPGIEDDQSSTVPRLVTLSVVNPARGQASISYTMPRAAHANVEVVDIAGKLVATLTDGDQRPGYYNLTWNRQDSKGRTVPAGVYFCTLDNGEKRISRKLVLTE